MAVFTNVAANVVDPVQISDSIGTLYTAPSTAGGYAEIVELSLTNDTTTVVTATLYYVPSGGSYGDDNIICKAINVPSDGTPVDILAMSGHIFLEPSGLIRGIASVASQVTMHMSVMEWS